MRNKQRLVQTVRTAKKTTTKNAIGETVVTWAEDAEVQASVLPITDAISVEMYGERANSMMRLTCKAGIEKGMRLWLAGETDETPMWAVESVEQWPNHTSAVIERRPV
ncbi:MAG: hypothetical protein GX916_10085 [Clostridiales bacterium]|jgi:head-tail adaptor|nr:hypothetical protein [Clostridiales bacterium]